MQDKTRNLIISICAIVVAIAVAAGTGAYFVKEVKNPSQESANVSNLNPQNIVPANNTNIPSPTVTNTSAENNQMAQIIAVKPHMITIQIPYTTCTKRTRVVMVQRRSGPPIAGTVIGGVAGGLLGNQVGGGSGRTVATAVGAVGGALVGSSVEQNMNKPQPRTIIENYCVRKTKTIQKQQGYEVTYIYQGIQNMRILKSEPVGNQIPVSVLQQAIN